MKAMESRRGSEEFPKMVKCGSVTVKIYRVSNKGRVSFTVVYTSNGKRVLRMFADFEEAHGEARRVADALEKGEFEVLELRNADRARYVNAMQALEPTGAPLELAAREYSEALKLLGGSASLIEAVRDYSRRMASALPSKTLPEAVQEMWSAKELEGASRVYMKVLRFYLG